MRHFRRLRRRLRTIGKRIRGRVARLVSCLVGEPGYAEAVAAFTVAAVEVISRRPAARRAVHEIARTFVVIVRGVIPPRDDFDDGPAWA